MFTIKGIIEYGIALKGGIEEIVAKEEGILKKKSCFKRHGDSNSLCEL